jgi:membrane protein implicated in regulation of membrane protease activity
MIVTLPVELALAAAVILAALEAVTGTFVLLDFCLGSLAVAVAEALSGEFNLTRDVLLFAAVATLAIIALRFAFARSGDTKLAKGDVNEY